MLTNKFLDWTKLCFFSHLTTKFANDYIEGLSERCPKSQSIYFPSPEII